jgi:hypothetical protein
VAETARRVLRRQRVNRMHAFARMYKAISGAIASGREIDTARTVLPSAQLTLDLDERYASQGGEPA